MAVADLAERLREDFSFYAPNCLQITSTTGQLIPFDLKPAQVMIEEAAAAQQAAGRPVRLIVPKARKEGVSTYATGKIVQRVTQRHNHNAILVAQDGETAGELLAMAQMMHANLPDPAGWHIKPPIANSQRRKEIVFGNPTRRGQTGGDPGINSRLLVQSAGEFEAGRGFTFHSVLGSEVGFWPDAKRKLTSLLNAVPDDPGTLVILESTSNGHNHWRSLCMDALEGRNDFEIVFLPWFAEPQYVKGFVGEEERLEFAEAVGTGAYGMQEPTLLETYGVTLEQLHWRRWAIANRCQGDMRVWSQEYPSTLEESFGATGRQVFNSDHVTAARVLVESQPQGEAGAFEAGKMTSRLSRAGTVNVPMDPAWKPRAGGNWRVFEPPEPAGQYVCAVDPAGEDVMDEDNAAHHACQIVDHVTGAQMAELEMIGDTDLVAEQVFLALTFYNRAWLAVETTGGYGYSMNRRIHKDWRHPFMYKRKRVDSSKIHDEDDRTGWDTNRATRGFLIDGAIEMLREGTHGIRSRALIRQLPTFIRDSRGKPVPAKGERSDLLLAWMIAQQVRQELPRRRAVTGGTISTTTRSAVTVKGW